MQATDKIYIAGHRGLVGSALLRRLAAEGYANFVCRTSQELDLRNQDQVRHFFAEERPGYVFLAAAKVGGIHANETYPAEFIYDNLLIESNVVDSAYRSGVKKLLFLGSSCIYPKLAAQPIKEEYLLTDSLEPTNECYAIAKIAGVKLCQAYKRQYGFNAISAMPTNLYGAGDNFHSENSHVIPALIRRFHEAKTKGASEVCIWGSGTPRREFMYVDDLAEALVFLMQSYEGDKHINIGVGEDVSIRELAELVAITVGFKGGISNDISKPDGTPQKLLDVSRLAKLGWKARTSLKDGLTATYAWYLTNFAQARK